VLKGIEVYCERKYRPAGVLLSGNDVIYFRFKLLLFTYLLPYLLTPCSGVLLEKLIIFQLVKKFPKYYGSSMVLHSQEPTTSLYSERG